MDDLFKTLLNAPKQGVFALENISKKEALVFCSKDVIGALQRFIKEGKNRSFLETFRFVFLDPSPNEVLVKWYIQRYQQEGMSASSNYTPVSYTPVIRIQAINAHPKVWVFLRSKGRLYIVSGIFDTMEEAEEFVRISYADSTFVSPVCALNEATRQYMKEY